LPRGLAKCDGENRSDKYHEEQRKKAGDHAKGYLTTTSGKSITRIRE
jgi:hypothetical protein